MVVQGIVKGNTVLLENNESVSSNRLNYLKELRLREKRPSDRDAAEINQYIRECRDHDRF